MIQIKPFRAYRPKVDYVSQVAAVPYDVVSTEEAASQIKDNPYSFLNVDKPESRMQGLQSESLDQAANAYLRYLIDEQVLIQESEECLYIYGLIRESQKQYGIVGCFACEDYETNKIKKHEQTREDKELERTQHVAACMAHTGPIFLTYIDHGDFDKWIQDYSASHDPLYDFVTEDGTRQLVYKIAHQESIKYVQDHFVEVPALYIADGHHRAAAACRYAREHKGEEREEQDYFLGVAFVKDSLCIMDYNRVIQDESNLSQEQLFETIQQAFEITKVESDCYRPLSPKNFGMRYEGEWYNLAFNQALLEGKDCVEQLDVSLLHDLIIGPLFGIHEVRTDQRIEFVGGGRGIEALNAQTEAPHKVAFSLYPTSIEELIEVADEERLMPPKSTWFEPKLKSGIFIHKF